MASSSLRRQPDAVADKVLKRAELGKMARRLQNCLALAQFKTKHGLEDLDLDNLEPRFEQHRRRKQFSAAVAATEGDILSDSSSSASDLPYPSRTLMSSPLKAGPLFSDGIRSSNGSTGHRKRTYRMSSFGHDHHDPHHTLSSPSKRFCSSPTTHRSFGGGGGSHHSSNGSGAWTEHHQLAQSSPIKPRRQQHFTTSTGPNVSLFKGSHRIADALATSPIANNYAAMSDDEDDLLPVHSFVHPDALRSSPPRTPPMRNRSLNRRGGGAKGDAVGGAEQGKTGEEGADLLLYLAASPSPAHPKGTNSSNNMATTTTTAAASTSTSARMDPPSTPPPKSINNMALPSSMMCTPGGGNLFPNTPGQTFDLSDFVNITPSPAPAQKAWKTPVMLGGGGRTPLSVARRRLTFDDFP